MRFLFILLRGLFFVVHIDKVTFEIYLRKQSDMITPMKKREGTWLIALSGGPDSMALADMALNSGTHIAAAHVNYHHRDQADEEEAWVRTWCETHGVACHVLNDPFEWEGNFEAAAREVRYDFFVRLVNEYGYAGIMTGHQEDDLIETYIMQKDKGITPEYWGLKEEIIYHGIRVYRPLLDYTKQQLTDYCNENGIRWYLDASNLEDDYARNRVRHEIVEHLSANERRMIRHEINKENAVIQEMRCRVRTQIRDEKTELKEYRRLAEEERLTLLRMIMQPKKTGTGLSRAFLMESDAVLMKHDDFVIDVRGRQLVQKDGFMFMHDPVQHYCYECRDIDEVKALGRKEAFYTGEGVPGVNALSVSESDFPLKIRNWQDGDRIRLRFGTKSVHRFFIDRRIPRYMRDSWPVVENREGTVILVPGLGCDVLHFTVCPDFNVIQYLL